MDDALVKGKKNMKRRANTIRAGFTLMELVMVVAVLSILTAIAIPRIGWGTMGGVQAETTAREFSGHLRLARSLAISNAASNSDGYKVEIHTVQKYFRIKNEATNTIVKGPITIPEGVTADAPSSMYRFHFTPLGKLQSGTTKTVQFTKSGKTVVVTVTPIGRITCQ